MRTWINCIVVLAISGSIAAAEKHGVHVTGTPGGLRTETTYDRGVKHGPTTAYFSNGAKMFAGQHTYGAKSGKWIDYDRNGRIVFTKTYAYGKLHGTRTQYGVGKSGLPVIVRTTTLVYGVQHGPYVEYTHRGTVLKRGEYVAGRRHGTWAFFTLDGKPSKHVTYACGIELGDGEAAGATDCGKLAVYIDRPRVPATGIDAARASMLADVMHARQTCEVFETFRRENIGVTVNGKVPRCNVSGGKP